MKELLPLRQLIIPVVLAACFACLTATSMAQRAGNRIQLRNDVGGYQGTEDFYTYRTEGGSFNSKVDLDDQTLLVAPLQDDAKSVIRFKGIPLTRGAYSAVNRLALVLTFKQPASHDTIMLHNLNPGDMWVELQANYHSLNGSTPWSGADGRLIDAWTNTDGLAIVTGSEAANSTLTIEIHPSDPSARKAVLDSWLDGNNQGMVIRGVSGVNAFYSSEAYNLAQRPELIIELSSY
jgi:hypothetical protein